MSDLLLGYGEVGKALEAVFGERRRIFIHDPQKNLHGISKEDAPEWMHIAYPYSEDFIKTTQDYIGEIRPGFVVIHSTVPVGTTDAINGTVAFTNKSPRIIYSPVRGIHPQLARYLREFPKWFYCDGALSSRAFETYCAQAGIQTRRAPSYQALEFAKLWETTSYSVQLVMWQEIERQVAQLPDPPEALSSLKEFLFEKRKVYDGDRGFVPIMDLVPGPLGGHCLSPNWELLRPLMNPQFYEWLTKTNDARKK